MKKSGKRAAAYVAGALAVLLFLTAAFSLRAQAYSITWPEKELYGHYYVLARTGDGDYNEGYEFRDIITFYQTVMENFKAWESVSGVDLTSEEVFSDASWKKLMNGDEKIKRKERVPNHEAFIALWQKMIQEGLTDRVNAEKARKMRAMLIRFFASEDEVWFRETDRMTTNYIRLTVPTSLIPSRYDPSDGRVGYCTQINYEYPGAGAVSCTMDAGKMEEALGLTVEEYEGLLNVLKRGYPVDAGLSGSGFEDLPAEARQQGTQYAVWLYLQGKTGNDGNGPAFSGRILTREMLKNVTDPELNPEDSAVDVLSYIDYLLETAEEAPVASISVDFGEFTEEDGCFLSEITLGGKYANNGIRLELEDLPEGSVLSFRGDDIGLLKTDERDLISPEDTGSRLNSNEKQSKSAVCDLNGFNTETITEKTLMLRIPKEGNDSRKIRITAYAFSGTDDTAVSLWFQEAAGSTQRMAVIEKETVTTEGMITVRASAVTPEKETIEPEEESSEGTTGETTEETTAEETTTQETTEEITESSEEATTGETTGETTNESVDEPNMETPGETNPAETESKAEPETGTETDESSTVPGMIELNTQEPPRVMGASKSQVLGVSPEHALRSLIPVILALALFIVILAGLLIRKKHEKDRKFA